MDKKTIIARVKEKLAYKWEGTPFKGPLEEWKKAVQKKFPKARFDENFTVAPGEKHDYGAAVDMGKPGDDTNVNFVGYWDKNNEGSIFDPKNLH